MVQKSGYQPWAFSGEQHMKRILVAAPFESREVTRASGMKVE